MGRRVLPRKRDAGSSKGQGDEGSPEEEGELRVLPRGRGNEDSSKGQWVGGFS